MHFFLFLHQVVKGHGPARQADEKLRALRVGQLNTHKHSCGDSPEWENTTHTHIFLCLRANATTNSLCKYGFEREN